MLVSYYLLTFENTGFGELSWFHLFLGPPLALGRNSRNKQVVFVLFFLSFKQLVVSCGQLAYYISSIIPFFSEREVLVS